MPINGMDAHHAAVANIQSVANMRHPSVRKEIWSPRAWPKNWLRCSRNWRKENGKIDTEKQDLQKLTPMPTSRLTRLYSRIHALRSSGHNQYAMTHSVCADGNFKVFIKGMVANM